MRLRRFVEAAVLAPNAVPVLIVLIATMKAMPWARGLAGIVVVHVLLNAGLVAVALVRLFRAKVGRLAELAWIEGVSRPRFLRSVALPILREELLLLFLFVFALCFSSFAVPLTLGGSRATTIEVLIYQKIRIESDWAGALGLSLVQLAGVFPLAWLLRRGPGSGLEGRSARVPLLAWWPGLVLVVLPVAVVLVGLCSGLARGFEQVRRMEVLVRELSRLAAGSALVGIGTGLLCVTFLSAIAYVAPTGILRRFLTGYVAPSSALTGFAILLLWRDSSYLATLSRVVLGVTLVSVPSFYRLQWDATLQAIETQRIVARLLGANDLLIFKRVVWPQVARPAFFIGGLAAFWAWGDFALSAVVAGRTVTLAMLAQALMNSYRLEAATVVVWVVIVGGALTFLAFVGVGNVLGSKSDS